MHRVRDGFEFLGYAVHRTAGSARIAVPEGTKATIRAKLTAALVRVRAGVARRGELLKTVRGVRAGLRLAEPGPLLAGLLGGYLLRLRDPPGELREAFDLAVGFCADVPLRLGFADACRGQSVAGN